MCLIVTFSFISRWRRRKSFPSVSIQLQPQGSSLGLSGISVTCASLLGVEWKRGEGGGEVCDKWERQDGEPCSGYVLLQGEWMRRSY